MPPNPIEGVRGDNVEFYTNLKKAFGKWVDAETDIFLDTGNYSLNERGFDPTDANESQMALVHENLVLGKCALGINMESLAMDSKTISGFNTMQTTPYEIILKSISEQAFPRSSEMHVFHFYDFIIQIKRNSINVLGRV